MTPLFEMPEGWEPPSQRILDLAKKVIEKITDDYRRELNAELMLTHHFWYNDIHFKMYLN